MALALHIPPATDTTGQEANAGAAEDAYAGISDNIFDEHAESDMVVDVCPPPADVLAPAPVMTEPVPAMAYEQQPVMQSPADQSLGYELPQVLPDAQNVFAAPAAAPPFVSIAAQPGLAIFSAEETSHFQGPSQQPQMISFADPQFLPVALAPPVFAESPFVFPPLAAQDPVQATTIFPSQETSQLQFTDLSCNVEQGAPSFGPPQEADIPQVPTNPFASLATGTWSLPPAIPESTQQQGQSVFAGLHVHNQGPTPLFPSSLPPPAPDSPTPVTPPPAPSPAPQPVPQLLPIETPTPAPAPLFIPSVAPIETPGPSQPTAADKGKGKAGASPTWTPAPSAAYNPTKPSLAMPPSVFAPQTPAGASTTMMAAAAQDSDLEDDTDDEAVEQTPAVPPPGQRVIKAAKGRLGVLGGKIPPAPKDQAVTVPKPSTRFGVIKEGAVTPEQMAQLSS